MVLPELYRSPNDLPRAAAPGPWGSTGRWATCARAPWGGPAPGSLLRPRGRAGQSWSFQNQPPPRCRYGQPKRSAKEGLTRLAPRGQRLAPRMDFWTHSAVRGEVLAGWWASALAARVGGAGGGVVTAVDKPLERQSPPPASRGRGLGAGAGAELSPGSRRHVPRGRQRRRGGGARRVQEVWAAIRPQLPPGMCPSQSRPRACGSPPPPPPRPASHPWAPRPRRLTLLFPALRPGLARRYQAIPLDPGPSPACRAWVSLALVLPPGQRSQ
ncbi:unnamed protein product [Rangifer tarandus platyrhynchus]|uniref:Uncharacterized protein n=1 Tax=Rangifer tarandus platyrhynchus TaxID=3082113 RepID=A0ABN9A3W1_RANTA|nr:unnamed protein product [Rangifer tarandus platyrhynchus]